MRIKTMTTQKKQTPLEKLSADKKELKRQCLEQEQKLNETFAYMQEHSGRLLLSGVSTLLFPHTKTSLDTDNQSANNPALTEAPGLSLSDYLSIGKSMMPTLWSLARPVLVTWGIGKIQTMLIHGLLKKKGKNNGKK
ncbi:hypothetical protein M2459_000965 [Parabacteroides sp. PF5-5]|uniref:hypothetical protein n=1 Tax=unclassified Parabacteroides TaxID=2649774 RepID=UPI0024767C9B|nr:MULTISPECIES: hypothetical protein [unclassified Parabacteroides]MDH6315048.1 hypothetical protein [Parabacteroides sp. PF5-13]MDH6326427.1 hypothetical protein [Parabacteroides sp. PH5-41]MDH6334227.1 hypothetical protein [Parabacteroides sp. PF5-5]MDH6345103.1 hypothetical protein [Parabacteroides sp. PH5-46]MDH6360248.1 hypothetical protein [Parabacteroides sp. PH5-16]